MADRRRLATRPDHDHILKKYFAKKGENRLSIAALETLAIVAYRQPITAPEVSEIRGVNSNQTIRTLLERRMIRQQLQRRLGIIALKGIDADRANGKPNRARWHSFVCALLDFVNPISSDGLALN